jgi:mono/diheme cytochrome c family protein
MKYAILLLLLCIGIILPLSCLLHAQYLTYSFKSDAKKGKQIYDSACVACHGSDGRGAPKAISGFTPPDTFPDFTRCDQTTAEVDAAYKAVIEHGGPTRGFSQIMPSFSEALSSQDIDDVIAY